jgi:hypothetical protein
VSAASALSGAGFSLIRNNAVQMVPYAMKAPVRAYLFAMDRLVQEGFYHVGNE